MEDFENTGIKSPCCDEEAWDMDCDKCDGSGRDLDGTICEECDGQGYIEGWYECSHCGDTFEE